MVKVSKKATEWLNENRDGASNIVARELSSTKKEVLPFEAGRLTMGLEITPQTISRSMDRMRFTTDIDRRVVQDVINYMAQLGYIKGAIRARDVLCMSFLSNE